MNLFIDVLEIRLEVHSEAHKKDVDEDLSPEIKVECFTEEQDEHTGYLPSGNFSYCITYIFTAFKVLMILHNAQSTQYTQ